MKKIIIIVEGGEVVDVEGLPEGWTYEIKDLDEDDEDDGEEEPPKNYKPKKTSSPSKKPMNYMQQFEAELRDKVAELADLGEGDEKNLAAFIKWAKEKHLSSYRNGVEVGRKDRPDEKKAKHISNKFKK